MASGKANISFPVAKAQADVASIARLRVVDSKGGAFLIQCPFCKMRIHPRYTHTMVSHVSNCHPEKWPKFALHPDNLDLFEDFPESTKLIVQALNGDQVETAEKASTLKSDTPASENDSVQTNGNKPANQPTKNPVSLICELCNQSFATRSGLAYHQQKSVCVRLNCKTCNRWFKTPAGLAYHEKNKVCHRGTGRPRKAPNGANLIKSFTAAETPPRESSRPKRAVKETDFFQAGPASGKRSAAEKKQPSASSAAPRRKRTQPPTPSPNKAAASSKKAKSSSTRSDEEDGIEKDDGSEPLIASRPKRIIKETDFFQAGPASSKPPAAEKKQPSAAPSTSSSPNKTGSKKPSSNTHDENGIANDEPKTQSVSKNSSSSNTAKSSSTRSDEEDGIEKDDDSEPLIASRPKRIIKETDFFQAGPASSKPPAAEKKQPSAAPSTSSSPNKTGSKKPSSNTRDENGIANDEPKTQSVSKNSSSSNTAKSSSTDNESEEDYACEHCGRKFTVSWGLKYHVQNRVCQRREARNAKQKKKKDSQVVVTADKPSPAPQPRASQVDAPRPQPRAPPADAPSTTSQQARPPPQKRTFSSSFSKRLVDNEQHGISPCDQLCFGCVSPRNKQPKTHPESKAVFEKIKATATETDILLTSKSAGTARSRAPPAFAARRTSPDEFLMNTGRRVHCISFSDSFSSASSNKGGKDIYLAVGVTLEKAPSMLMASGYTFDSSLIQIWKVSQQSADRSVSLVYSIHAHRRGAPLAVAWCPCVSGEGPESKRLAVAFDSGIVSFLTIPCAVQANEEVLFQLRSLSFGAHNFASSGTKCVCLAWTRCTKKSRGRVFCGLASGRVCVLMPPSSSSSSPANTMELLPVPHFMNLKSSSLAALGTELGLVRAVKVCPEDSTLLASLQSTRLLLLWDILDSSSPRAIRIQAEDEETDLVPLTKLAWLDNETIVVGDERGRVWFVNRCSSQVSKPVQTCKSSIVALCAAKCTSPQIFLTAARQGTTALHYFDENGSRELIGSLKLHRFGRKQPQGLCTLDSTIDESAEEEEEDEEPSQVSAAAIGPVTEFENACGVWAATCNSNGLVALHLFHSSKQHPN